MTSISGDNESLPRATGSGTLFSTDGEVSLVVVDGGFCEYDGLLDVSLEAEPAPGFDWPPCLCFALQGVPHAGDLHAVQVLRCETDSTRLVGGEIPYPRALAYFSSYATWVAITWKIRGVFDDEIELEAESLHSDSNYYDERARPEKTVLLARIPRRSYGQLFGP